MASLDDGCVVAIVALLLGFQLFLGCPTRDVTEDGWDTAWYLLSSMVLFSLITALALSDTAMFLYLFAYHFVYLFSVKIIGPSLTLLYEVMVQQLTNLGHHISNSGPVRAITEHPAMPWSSDSPFTLESHNMAKSIWVFLDLIRQHLMGFLMDLRVRSHEYDTVYGEEGPMQVMQYIVLIIRAIAAFNLINLASQVFQRLFTRVKKTLEAVLALKAPGYSTFPPNASSGDIKSGNGYDVDQTDARGYQNDQESVSSEFEVQVSEAFTEDPWTTQHLGGQYDAPGMHTGQHFKSEE
ncbi:uncharacterized protein K452DRAFT_313148 [Aplosporella prunicola CBS 121167]|uniref:Uncharacterized protein n=1 Tax=Aplosporella prunicola CBS 121167 TaxID=1176127 RepID=A0A6A6AXH3_9PEZI|nr:uncharacterized protein K452DRAFT_313148 [Aplosporella prunicola CBS 121167]KAF2136450.1 hypothetical protein K452DRAFT_313148 [Aplosporella prunicola CBS 121167]